MVACIDLGAYLAVQPSRRCIDDWRTGAWRGVMRDAIELVRNVARMASKAARDLAGPAGKDADRERPSASYHGKRA
jgi:hypothetical protein